MVNATETLAARATEGGPCPACEAPASPFVGWVRLYGEPGKPGRFRRCINAFHGAHRGPRPSAWVY